MAGNPNDARALLQEGLALYGRGDLAAAVEAWRHALQIEPDNVEAQKLVSFVEQRINSGVVDNRRAARNMPASGEGTASGVMPTLSAAAGIFDEEALEDPSGRATREAIPIVKDDGGPDEAPMPPGRPRRDTLVSALPGILAPSTRFSDHKTPPRGHVALDSKAAAEFANRATPVPSVPFDPKVFMGGEIRAAEVLQDEPTNGGNSAEFDEIPSDELDALVNDGLSTEDEILIVGEPSYHPNQPIRDITRPIGHDAAEAVVGLPRRKPALTIRADTPLDVALECARHRGVQLVDECRSAYAAGNVAGAAVAADDALDENEKAPVPGITEIIEPARPLFAQVFAAHVGSEEGVPQMSADSSALNTSNFDHRTGFLLSCIDGCLPIQTLIDISGMPRFDCLRTLSRLLNRGIIRIE